MSATPRALIYIKQQIIVYVENKTKKHESSVIDGNSPSAEVKKIKRQTKPGKWRRPRALPDADE